MTPLKVTCYSVLGTFQEALRLSSILTLQAILYPVYLLGTLVALLGT